MATNAPPNGNVIAKVTLATPMPVDAFVILMPALLGMKAGEATPVGFDDAGETIPEQKLYARNDVDGGYMLVVDETIKLRSVFGHGHFEIRWVEVK